jgi:hypothetical protein
MTNDRLNSQFSISNSLVNLLPCEYLIFGNSINAQCHEKFIGKMFDVCLTQKKRVVAAGFVKTYAFIRLLPDNAQLHSAKLMKNWKFNAE